MATMPSDDLARACDELGIEEWDSYGERGAAGPRRAGLAYLEAIAAEQSAAPDEPEIP